MVELSWFFLRVQVGREERIRKSLVARIKQAGLEERVAQVIVPTEEVAEVREGKRRIRKRKLFPGYLMMQADLSDEVWFSLRETPGFGDFVGARTAPTPMTDEEVENVLGRMRASQDQPKMSVQFQKGDRVKIKQGPFENIDGVIEDVHPEKGTLEVAVTIFGRSTPVSLGYWEVEPV